MIEKHIMKIAERYQIHGYSIQIIENYSLKKNILFGYTALLKPIKINKHTIFQGASLSKTIAAIAIIKLAEENLVQLDNDINEYLYGRKSKSKSPITIRQLLCHSAGMTISGFKGYEIGRELPTINNILQGTYPANSLR